MSSYLNVEFLAQVYLWIAIGTTVFFVLKLLAFSLFGMDDGSGDLVGTDVDTGFNFISFQSILAFLMGFGWLGYASLEWHFSGKISVIFGIIGGLILMFLSAYLMFLMKKLDSTPKYDVNSCLNKTGTSYTKFEPKGFGKIQIEFNGKLETMDAWNDSDNEIGSFNQIKVIRVDDGKLFIKEIG